MNSGSTIVANIRKGLVRNADTHLFCGRETSFRPQPGLINTKMGNPHPVGRICPVCKVTHAQSEAAHAYVPDRAKVERIADFVIRGKQVALYCFCNPEPCHCDRIKEAVDKLVQEKTEF
jgi:hypothetical protein